MQNINLLILILALSLIACKQKKTNTLLKSNTYKVASVNNFAAKSVYPMPHGDPSQQDATALSGPLDTSRALHEDEIQYVFTGPASIGAYPSSKYNNGKRALWVSSINGIFKLDETTYEVIDQIPSLEASKYTEDVLMQYTKIFDQSNTIESISTAGKAAAILKDISGVYTVIDVDYNFFVADKEGNITKYGDTENGDFNSKIEAKSKFTMPKEVSGPTLGMNLTYDGWIVLPTEEGYLVAVSRDFKEYYTVRLQNSEKVDTKSQGLGQGWVRNSIAIDKDNGIYVASRDFMHKVIWTGNGFSTKEKDGAWVAPYSNKIGKGTGATPSLMGFENEDKFVVITDGDSLMNVVLFWRNEIPKKWKQLPNTKTRRIAGKLPVTMGKLDLKKIQTEQSCVVAGNGVFVVNNTPRNAPQQLPIKAHGLLVSHLGSNPNFQPFGVEKFQWNTKLKQLEVAWVNTKVSSPNGVPWVSLGSNRVYFLGARNNKWTLEALNWATGESDFYYTIGGQKYNSLFSSPIINEDATVMYGSSWGRVKLKPKK